MYIEGKKYKTTTTAAGENWSHVTAATDETEIGSPRGNIAKRFNVSKLMMIFDHRS